MIITKGFFKKYILKLNKSILINIKNKNFKINKIVLTCNEIRGIKL